MREIASGVVTPARVGMRTISAERRAESIRISNFNELKQRLEPCDAELRTSRELMSSASRGPQETLNRPTEPQIARLPTSVVCDVLR